MSGEIKHSESCQVDFYLLGELSPGAARLACRLALMALERTQNIFIITGSDASSEELDELMWQYPEGRFIPHAIAGAEYSGKAPVNIGTLSDLSPADVVINLCSEAVPQPERFSRLLEIVPYADNEKEASRVKFRMYRNQNLNPQTHEINK